MDIKKIIARLPVGFVEDSAAWGEQELKDCIVKAETVLRDTEREMKSNEKLQGAKEIVKDIGGAYNDTIKAQKAKIAYSLHLLEERGQLGTGESDEG